MLTVALGGCGGPKLGSDHVPVTGTVVVEGRDVEEGVVVFSNRETGDVYTGKLDSGGGFRLVKSRSVTGVLPGEYDVRVEAWESRALMDDQGNPVAGKPAAHQKYQDFATSELSATVTEDGDNDFEFVLDPAG